MHASYHKLLISYHDELEYKTLLEEIFKKHTYYAEFDTSTPVIIDAGAHIGLTTLYFHSLYPHARIICIEPNPQNLTYLHKNIENNDVSDVTVIDKALVGKKETRSSLPLYTDSQQTIFSSLSQGGWTGDKDGVPVMVETIKLSTIIQERVDLLKIDIEGMETEVLLEAGDALRNVQHLICEFHKTPKYSEEKLLRFLKQYFSTIEVTRDERIDKRRDNQLLCIEAKR